MPDTARAKPRPFIDTYVLFSAIHRPGTPPSHILECHVAGRIAMVISRQVLEELVTTIREKRADLLPLAHALLANAPPEICPDPTASELQRARQWVNPDDAPILAAAIEARADCLVTGDTRHFTPGVAKAAGIAIMRPPEYLATLEDLHPTG